MDTPETSATEAMETPVAVVTNAPEATPVVAPEAVTKPKRAPRKATPKQEAPEPIANLRPDFFPGFTIVDF
ncbi:hypothetical protein [uncultured Agrobacterium sp.]|uniref:hypothetical protein n=1 Tax=uncultured Agrobacterium sp. TaxID=157277 RepID=UPI0025D9F60C|nr:hypothetical protein [uncultured Agrobacterium sp.]